MEVGAVKQAFNNEVILLKKNLNQAKVHTIHKLTRKAKQLTEKKAPEHLKEKLKKKAESAVNEVLIIKKIKARDIAKFIITHTGEVKDYLNRPKVDNDKACARLLLHKALQDKHKFIRGRFGNVPIKDLFMSRQERIKLKKEAREEQKNKQKGKKGKVVHSEGDWDVEDVEMPEKSKETRPEDMSNDGDESDDGRDVIGGNGGEDSNDESEHSEVEQGPDDENDSNEEQSMGEDQGGQSDNGHIDGSDDDDQENDIESSEEEKLEAGKFVKLKPINETKKSVEKPKPTKNFVNTLETKMDNKYKSPIKDIENTITFKPETIKLKLQEKRQDKKVKENKNKNLNEKLQNRKFKKDTETPVQESKVVDPFFITSTGENYMSLAEPRQPDEVKEIHKQGNRQLRRAVMFGHVPKIKPRWDNGHNNFRSNKYDKQNGFDNDNQGFRKSNDRFGNDRRSFNDRNANFDYSNSKFNDRNSKFNDSRNSKFNDSKFSDSKNIEPKEEKLHPSWEAKKKQSGILPFQGKKIVFD